MSTLIVDCDTCVMRDLACQDCVVSVLLGAPPSVELDPFERRAIDMLAGAGLVPRLRPAELAAPGNSGRPLR